MSELKKATTKFSIAEFEGFYTEELYWQFLIGKLTEMGVPIIGGKPASGYVTIGDDPEDISVRVLTWWDGSDANNQTST